MPTDEHPFDVTRATGRAVDAAVLGIGRASDERCTWVQASTRPILRPINDELEAVLLLARPIAWVPDSALPEVIAEVARAKRGWTQPDEVSA